MKMKNLLAGVAMALAVVVAAPAANAVTSVSCGSSNNIGGVGDDNEFIGLFSAPGGAGSCAVEFVSSTATPGLAQATIGAINLKAFTGLTMSWVSVVNGVLTSIPIVAGVNSLATLFLFPSDATQSLVFDFTNSNAGKGGFDFEVSFSAVPLPPAALLLISGLAGIGVLSRRRRSKVEAV